MDSGYNIPNLDLFISIIKRVKRSALAPQREEVSSRRCRFFSPLIVLAALTADLWRPVLASLILTVCDWEGTVCDCPGRRHG